MKITNKENLCKYLQENLINDDRAEVFSEVVWIQTNEGFNESIKKYEKIMMEYEDSITFWYDANIYSLVEELCLLTDEQILNNFGSYYNDAVIIANEDGEGFVFFEALY